MNLIKLFSTLTLSSARVRPRARERARTHTYTHSDLLIRNRQVFSIVEIMRIVGCPVASSALACLGW